MGFVISLKIFHANFSFVYTSVKTIFDVDFLDVGNVKSFKTKVVEFYDSEYTPFQVLRTCFGTPCIQH